MFSLETAQELGSELDLDPTGATGARKSKKASKKAGVVGTAGGAAAAAAAAKAAAEVAAIAAEDASRSEMDGRSQGFPLNSRAIAVAAAGAGFGAKSVSRPAAMPQVHAVCPSMRVMALCGADDARLSGASG